MPHFDTDSVHHSCRHTNKLLTSPLLDIIPIASSHLQSKGKQKHHIHPKIAPPRQSNQPLPPYSAKQAKLPVPHHRAPPLDAAEGGASVRHCFAVSDASVACAPS